MVRFAFAVVLGLALSTPPIATYAAGNLAQIPATRLELNVDTVKMTFSQTEFEVETGKYYRLTITSDGVEEVLFKAPDLFRNVWVNQFVVAGREITAETAPSEIRISGAGTTFFAFVAMRPGDYEFWAEGYQNMGLRGRFIVR